jgi:hypothetical protein
MTTRREFLPAAGYAALGAVATPNFLTHCSKDETPLPEGPCICTYTGGKPEQNCCFVFQGDSVTESGRSDGLKLGTGYVFHIGSRLMADFPQSDLVIYNRGKGGDMLGDILQRWDTDTLSLKPDVLSILIGINHTIAGAGDLGDSPPPSVKICYMMHKKTFPPAVPVVVSKMDTAKCWI